jgi:sugar phosphate isomerase/epimerase
MVNHLFGLSADFFEEPTVEKWREAKDAGFTEAEIKPFNNITLADIPRWLEKAEHQYWMLVEAGINPSSAHMPYGPDLDVSDLNEDAAKTAVEADKLILDWMAGKGIGIAVLHPSWRPIKEEERRAKTERSQISVKTLGEYAEFKNIILAVENVSPTTGGLSLNSENILDITDSGNAAGICFDVNHLLTEPIKDFIKKAGAHIVTVHFSDNDGKDERHWIPGEGVIDWKKLVTLLESEGYTGRYIFETSESAECAPKLGRKTTPIDVMQSFKKTAGIK